MEPLRNVVWRYRNVTECYKASWSDTGVLQNITEYGSTAHHYRTLRNITEHCSNLRNDTEAFQIITECYRMLQNVTEHCGTLRKHCGSLVDVTESKALQKHYRVLRSNTEHYGSTADHHGSVMEPLQNIIENIDFAHH